MQSLWRLSVPQILALVVITHSELWLLSLWVLRGCHNGCNKKVCLGTSGNTLTLWLSHSTLHSYYYNRWGKWRRNRSCLILVTSSWLFTSQVKSSTSWQQWEHRQPTLCSSGILRSHLYSSLFSKPPFHTISVDGPLHFCLCFGSETLLLGITSIQFCSKHTIFLGLPCSFQHYSQQPRCANNEW